MKPIHHAMVSARLFGGTPEHYLEIHNAFDLTKSALPDMRHRAALHSVDHGAAVMSMIFPERIGEASREEICVQHVNDDQGFSVRLDDWLAHCEVPAFVRVRRKPPAELEGFALEPETAAAARWGGEPEDYARICKYFTLPEAVSDHPLAPAVSRNAFSVFFSELAFGAAITVETRTGRRRYVPVRDIGERICLATWGCIPTLPDVFAGMPREDWMTGSRVARSRRRRCRRAGRPDLFSEEMQGLAEIASAPPRRTDPIADLVD